MPTNIQANLILDDSQPRQIISRLAKDVGSLNFAQPLGRISGDAKEFTKSLEAATARVTAFGLTAGAIYKVSQAIREGAKATIEVDKQLVELNTYLGKSRNELEGFSQSLFKVAKNSAVPFEAAAEAAKEFARQGLSANEILKRTGSALTLARIAGISYAQAVNGITTAINSFNKEALTSEDITNKLIAVDTRFAVSSAQLNEALTRVGSSAEESGLSIDKLIATVTAAQQITGRGGAVIGNALKTIFTRLQRPEVLGQLEMLGVAVKDQNGYLLDGISILKNYSDATKNLSQAEKSRTAELVGGIYQINQVNALIKDLSSSNSVYADALRVSSAATDEAKKKNEELNTSMAALLQQTKTSAQEAAAALGSSLLDPLVKLGSAVSEGLLKLVSPNSDLFGQGEDSGKKFADGLRKGAASILGKTLGAGGLPLLVATGGLLAAKYAKFGVSSLKQLGKSSSGAFPSEKELQIQKRINDTLRENPGIIDSVISRKMNLAQAEAEVLRLIQEQNRSLLAQSRITGRVTSTVRTAQKASRKGIGRLFAEGYIPDTGVEEAAFQLEESTARTMGAVNPKAEVVQATIKGKTGPIIVNDKEKIIQNYGGTGETAIIPNYRNLDEIPRMSKGYIPNFAWSKSNKMPKDFLIKYPQSKAAIKAGRMYSPEARAMLQKLQAGEKIDRDLLDALIERDIPIREVIAPSSVKDLPSQALIKNALDKEQAKRANKLSELPAGSEITVRQDVPSMTRKGVGVVKTESSGGFKSYDSFVAFDNPVMGKSAGLERASLNIGAGKEKSPLLKISGTLSKDQSLPKDLKNWTQVGYNPDRHSYYYDRKTKKPIVGGQQAIQIGNTVFVKEAMPGNREDFSYAKGYIPNFALSYKLPPEPFSSEIPENFIRLIHQTSSKNLGSIKRSGITLDKAKGIEGPRGIYADEKGFYGDPEMRPSVEFAVDKNRFSYPPFVQGGDVKPSEIIGIHKPWHRHARYIENDPRVLKATLAGEHDGLTGDTGKAVRFIKRKYKNSNSSGVEAKASGYVPNFAFSSMKAPASGDRKFVDPETYSYLRYKLSNDKKAIDLKFSKSELKGQGWQMFERLGKTARRMGLPVRSSNLSSQANDVLDITDASLARSGKYGIEEVLKVAFPQLIHRQKGSAKNTSLSVNVDDGLNNSNNELSSKNIFSTVSGFASEKYKGNAKLLRNSIIDGSFDISNVETNFAGGRVPNFAKSKFIQNIIDSYKASLIEKDPIRFNAAQKNENYYPNVNSELKNLSVSSGVSLEKLAYGLAALSGNTADSAARKGIQRIANNQPYDDLVLLPENIEKVKKMLASSGSTEELMSILGKGAKTQNFAQSLLLSKNFSGFGKYKNPLNTPSVMDSWAIYVRNGGALKEKYDRGAVSEKQKSKVFSQSAGGYKYYNKLVKEYGAAAKELGVPVRELQARTWAWARTQVGSRTRNDSFASGRIPNFANPRIVGQGSNLFVSSLYDTLSGEHGGGPEYPFARPGMGAAFLNKEKTNDMIKLIKPFVESGSRVIFGAQAGRMGGDLGLIQGLAGNKMVVEALKASYPKLTSKFIQEGTSTANLTSLFDKFYKTLGPDKMREIVSPFIEPDILKFYQKNKNFGSSISRLAEFGSESLTQASSSQHSIYPAAIRGKALSRIEPVNAQKLFQTAGGLSDEETKKLFGTVRVAKLPIGFRFEKGDAASKLLGLSQGYIPNFSGLSKAVSREKTMSGLPASQIMTHFDGGGNPIAVTNKRDEPNGLKDVPNFALPSRQLVTVLSRLGLLKGRNNLANPISAGVELFAGSAASSTLDTLAENELIDPRASTFANVAIPGAIGLKNIGKGIFGKGSKMQRGIAVASGVGQLTAGTLAGFQGGADLGNRINIKKFEQALDRSRKTFQDLTENTLELSNSLAKLDDAYRDPKADPKQILKLSASIADLLSKVKGSNPGLVSKLASETTLAGKQAILEDNAKESQRIESVKEQALKFSSKGTILGKDAPKELDSFFRSVINSGNQDLLKQDLSKAGPANFSEVLSKGGLNVEEFSNVFKTDELKKGFLDALKLTQKLNEISSNQEAAIIDVSKPLTRKKQQTEDRREIRSSISKALEDQSPELASFAGGFSKRAGISAASDASLAIKTTQSSVSFQNSLLAQLSDKEFTKGLPSQVQAKLNAIETPGVATGRDLESIKQLPGLSKAQVAGIEKLIQFNSLQTREIQKAGTIANETKNIQLKFLALQEKLAFGGDIKTSINPQMRAESMSAGLRGPLTYQLGTLFGSRRTQVGGATDFLTETMQKYPGLLQTKNGKEPADISGVKRELTGLNAMDMQRDLLKRANMAQMMGLGQTSGLLRNKAFDSKYLFESAGLKADALFGSPEVPGEVKSSMQDYEKFGVQSAKQAKADDSELKQVEDLLVPIKQQITEQATALGQGLVSGFEASLKSTFGDKGIQADVVKLVTSQVKGNASESGAAQASDGPPVKNFANPVNDAITREKMALAKRGIMGVPNFAMASINLERSSDLANASNPYGFGVTNSIDEKNGLRSLGMKSSGFVPNYALPSWMSASNLDKARNIFTNADDAKSLIANVQEGNAGGIATDLAGPALDAAKFLAKGVAKKTALGAAGLGLDIGEYIVKPLSEKAGLTDYLADRMYNSLYAKPEKSNIAKPSDAYNSRLGNDLIDPSPEYLKKGKAENFAKSGYVPNYALFGDKVAAAGLAAAQSDKLFVYDKGTGGFHKVSSSGEVDYKTSFNNKSLPKDAKTISTELYASPRDNVINTQKRGSNILGIKDPKVSKLNELQISTIPKSQLLDPLLDKLSGGGLSQGDNLTPENLRDEVNKLTGGKRSLIKTAFGENNYGGKGVFGRNTDLGLIDYETIIKRYKSGADSGFFAQTAVEGPHYGETRVHVAVDAKGRVKLVKGATINKYGYGVDALSKEYISGLMGENPGATRKQMEEVARANKKASEAIAVKSAREYVKKFGIKNTIFGVDTIATTLESAQEAGATAKTFNDHTGRRMGAIVIEMNPTDVAGSSGYMKGSAIKGLIKSVLGIENNPQGNAGNVLMGAQNPQAPRSSGAPFNPDTYSDWLRGQQRMAERLASQDRIPDESPAQSTIRPNRGLPPAPRPTGPGSNLIGAQQPSMPAGFAPRNLPPLPRPTGPGSNLIGTQQPSMPAGFAPKGGGAPPIPGGTGGGLPPRDARGRFTARGGGGTPTGGSGGLPPSNSYFGSMAFGSNGGNPPGGSSASTTGSSTILNKLKGVGKYGGKALGGLAGAASIYEYYEGFQEAKKDKYAGAAKMFEATGGLAITGAGLAGAGLATTFALPLAVGALGYGAIKGVEATGLLDATYGAGYGTVGLGAIGSKSIRGMTSRTAFNDDMIVARKQELLKGINRYNSVAGNPLVSTEFQVSRSTAAQKRKDKQDLEQLNNRLDEESQATRAGITSRATAAGAAETARLNQESAAQEEARSSKLRKSFLESFDKNAEANGYTTTKDKANYLLGQEGKNGIGSFKYTDFKDQEFAKSFDIYKTAKEAEAAREANRVIPKSAIEFRDRPMPSFPQDVLEEATRTGRSAERVIQDRAESNVRGGASSQGMTTPEINAQMSRDYTADTGLPSFPKDVLEEAVRRRVSAEQVMKERAGGGVPNFAAMSNGMMSSGDVYSRMRSSAPRNFAPSYAQGSVPNFAAGDFTNAVTEALKTGITSAFPGGGGSSSTVSNSNVINIDGRSSIQNAPDEAMQGIISILFDKIPELKKLGPAALNFKK